MAFQAGRFSAGLMAGDSVSTSIFVLLFPKPKSPEERVSVIAHAATRGQLCQLFGIASSKNHVVGFEGVSQSVDHVRNVALPFFLTVLFQSAHSDVILVSSFPIGEVAEFHGLDGAFHN